MAHRIDLNADLGEGFGAWAMGADQEILGYVTSANVACGFHAGDPSVIDRTVGLALRAGVAVGAHPSHLDLRGFGRREIQADIRGSRARRASTRWARSRPSRAATARRLDPREAPRRALQPGRARRGPRPRDRARGGAGRPEASCSWASPPRRPCAATAEAEGLRFAPEAFADRAYAADGHLVPRSAPGCRLRRPGAGRRPGLSRSRGRPRHRGGRQPDSTRGGHPLPPRRQPARGRDRPRGAPRPRGGGGRGATPRRLTYPRVLAVGDAAVTVELGAAIDPVLAARVRALDRALLRDPFPGFRESVPTYRSLLVPLRPRGTSASGRARAPPRARSGARGARGAAVPSTGFPCSTAARPDPTSRRWRARSGSRRRRSWPCTRRSSTRHSCSASVPASPTWGSCPRAWTSPALATPRVRVPARSVGIAGRQTGIYPVASPGGWRLLGRDRIPALRPDARAAVPSRPGDRVRFEPVDALEESAPDARSPPAASIPLSRCSSRASSRPSRTSAAAGSGASA